MGTFTKTFGIMSRGRWVPVVVPEEPVEDLEDVLAMNMEAEEFELSMNFDEVEFYLQMT